MSDFFEPSWTGDAVWFKIGDVQLNSASTMGDAIMKSSPKNPIEMELSIMEAPPSYGLFILELTHL